jgi:hypothetical protein
MQMFELVPEGVRALKALVANNNKKVGALLIFQSETEHSNLCFLFESKEGAVSQLIKEYATDLTISGVDRQDMASTVAARQVVVSTLAGVLETEEPGHAEEFLIEHFDIALRKCLIKTPKIQQVLIFLSHSPCTTNDANPSSTAKGVGPVSCTAKLAELARRNPHYSFSVNYWKKFGVLERVASNSASVLEGLVDPPQTNLRFREILAVPAEEEKKTRSRRPGS